MFKLLKSGTLLFIFVTFFLFIPLVLAEEHETPNDPAPAPSDDGGLIGAITPNFGSGGLLGILASIFIGMVGFGLAVGFLWYVIRRKKHWNMKVEFKIPRDLRQGQHGEVQGTITKEWGKGFYDGKRGVVLLKRKGKKEVAMKPFDVKRFVSAGNILTVIQIGIEDYRPVFEESYLEVVDDTPDENGVYQEGALLHTKIDTSESKSWKSTFEREAKNTYSIANFLTLHGDKLVWGLVVLIVLIGQAIVITKLN